MELQSKIFNKLKQRFTELMSSCRHNKTSLDTHTHHPHTNTLDTMCHRSQVSTNNQPVKSATLPHSQISRLIAIPHS